MRGRRYKPPTRLNAQGSAESASDDEDSANGNEEAEGQEGDSEQDAKLLRLPDGTDAIDITDDWRSGGLVLSEAGTYALSGDVETTGMLTIAAPAGEVVVLDFAGHKATVNGDAYAGIDVGSSVGEVVIRNSSYKEGTPNANLVVEGNKVTDALCGIQANYAPQEGDVPTPKLTLQGVGIDVNLNTVDADHAESAHDAFGVYFGYADGNDSREAVDALLQDISVSVRLNEFDLTDEEKADLKKDGMVPLSEKTTGIAYGIYTNVEEVGLSGVLATTTVSANNTCDLYSVSDASFGFDRTSEPQSTMRVYAAGNGESTVFATLADDFEDGSTVLSNLENASDSETILKQDDRAIVFALDIDDIDYADGKEGSTAEELSTGSAEDAKSVSSMNIMMTAQESGAVSLAQAEAVAWDGAVTTVAVEFSGDGELSASSSDEAVATALVSQDKDGDGNPVEGKATLTLVPEGFGEATVTVAFGGASAELRLSSRATWTVGGAGYRTSVTAFQAAAGSDAPATLNRDLPGEAVNGTFAATAGQQVKVDLAGHEVGSLAFSTAADVTVSTSAEGAKVTGSDSTASNKITRTGVSNAGAGKLTLVGVAVDISADGAGATGTAQGVSQSGAGETVLSGGSVKIEGGESSAKIVSGAVATKGGLTIDGCSVRVKSANTGATVVAGARSNGKNKAVTKLAVSGATIDVEGAGSKVAGIYVGSGNEPAALSLDGRCSVSGTHASAWVNALALPLGAGFSADAGSFTVRSDSAFADDAFATVAEGGDARAMAAAFAPAEGDTNYAGKAAVADGRSLKWGEAGDQEDGKIAIPTAQAGITYNGSEQVGIAPQDGFSVVGGSATNAGDYTATATLTNKGSSTWEDGTTDDKAISWTIGKARLTATYVGEELASASDTPKLVVDVSGWVNGESAESAAGYTAPAVTAPAELSAGQEYELTPAGGSADNYEFTYKHGTLKVAGESQLVEIRIHSNWPDGSGLEEEVKTISGKPGDKVSYSSSEYGFKYDNWGYSAFSLDAAGTQKTTQYTTNTVVQWTIPESSVDLYPIWVHRSSYIQFNGVYGDGYYNNGQVIYRGYAGDPVTYNGQTVDSAPSGLSRPGYTFVGWQLIGSRDVIPADEFVLPETFPYNGIGYYAVWEEVIVPVDNMDLYPLLTQDDVALKNRNITLPGPGSYYLSKDVAGFTGSVSITKKGAYEIDLHGNSITFGDAENGGYTQFNIGTGFSTTGSASFVDVSIVGGAEEGRAALTFSDGGCINVNGDGSLAIKDVDMTTRYKSPDSRGSFTGVSVLSARGSQFVSAGSNYPKTQNLTIENCSLTLDLANQTNGGSTSHSGTSAAVAVELTSPNLNDVTIKDSTISVHTGTPAKKDGEAQGSIDAIALYACNEANSLTIEGTSLDAVADQGSAFAVYQFYSYLYPDGNGLSLLDGVSLTAKAGGTGQQYAVGLLNAVGDYKKGSNGHGKPVLLGGALSIDAIGGSLAVDVASDCPASEAQSAPYVIGDGFSASEPLSYLNDFDYSIQIEKDGIDTFNPPIIPVQLGDRINAGGTYLARFADGIDDAAKEAIAAVFANGAASGRASVVLGQGGLCFDEDAAHAEAYIVRNGEREVFGTFEDVARSAKDGETVFLNKGLVRLIEFPATDAEQADGADAATMTFNVDLNGFTVGGIACSSAANVNLLTSASSQPQLMGTKSGNVRTAIWQKGTGRLTVSGLKLGVTDGNEHNTATVGAIVDGGTLALDGTSVDVTTLENEATGVLVRKGVANLRGVELHVTKTLNGADTVTACGIDVMKGAEAVVSGGSVKVDGAAEQVYAVRADDGSALLIDGTKLAAEAGESARTVADAYATGGSTIELDSAQLSVGASGELSDAITSGIRAWNVKATSKTEDGAATAPRITLRGAIAMANALSGQCNVYHEENPLYVAENFALGDSTALGVQSSGLADGDIFAVTTGDGYTLEQKTSMFLAAGETDNVYMGNAVALSGVNLRWAVDAVASIDGKATYTSLAAAFAAADEGDTVRLLRDTTSLPLVANKQLTVDLAGKKLALSQAIELGDTAGAIVARQGRLTITDSSESGTGIVDIGVAPVHAALGSSSYSGFVVEESGALTIRDAAVRVYWAADGTAGELRGITITQFADSGSAAVELAGAVVQVGSNYAAVGIPAGNGASPDLAAGAHKVVGVYNNDDVATGTAIEVDSSSRIEATANMRHTEAGDIVESDRSGIGTGNLGAKENALNQTKIREFDPESDPELYERICEAFLVNAKFDDSASTGVYGARIYYAAPMELSDGTYVWAFSDVKDGDDVGKDIKPTIIYLQSRYSVPSTAVGIDGNAYVKSLANIAGNVSAESLHGNALAVNANGTKGARYAINGARLSAISGGTTQYLGLPQGNSTPNILERIGFKGSTDVNHFYPKQSMVGEITEMSPSAYAVNVGIDHVSVTLDGRVELSSEGMASAHVCGGPIVLASDFAAAETVTVAGARGETNVLGSTFAEPIGDSRITTAQRDLFADAFGEFLPVVSDDGASLDWGARYTVKFLDASGAAALMAVASPGYDLQPPDASAVAKSETKTTEYVLAGWSTDPYAKPGDEGVLLAGASFSFSAPDGAEAGSEVVYYPVYEARAKSLTYTFAGAVAEDGTALPVATIAVETGKGMTDEALGKVPNAQSYGNRVFVGWEAKLAGYGTWGLRTVDPSALGNITETEDLTFKAKYITLAEGQRVAAFKVDDYVYACAIDEGDQPIARAAIASATGESDPAVIDRAIGKEEAGVDWKFVGWVAGWHDFATDAAYPDAADFGPEDELPSIDATYDGDVVWYTAAFSNEGKTLVTITLHYWNDWTESGNWSYNRTALVQSGTNLPLDKKRVRYGTNLGDIVAGENAGSVDSGLEGVIVRDYALNTGTSSSPNWREHKFLGWSVRPDDKLPLLPPLLPLVGSGTAEGGYTSTSENYYAIYSDADMGAAAAFNIGDKAIELTVSANGTLEDALRSLAESDDAAKSGLGAVSDGQFVPTAPDGKKFIGWSLTEDGAAIGNPALSKVALASTFDAPKDGDGKCQGTISYYAVFVDADQELCDVLLDSAGADNWAPSAYSLGKVAKGEKIALPDGFQVPHKAGHAFTGWNTKADGSGNSFNLEKDSVTDDELTLFAQYEAIPQPEATGDGAAVDVSGVYLSKSGALDADEGGVSVTLSPAKNDDDAIALGQRDRALGYYSLRALVERGGTKIDVTDQLEGTIRITLPIPDGYADKELLVFVKTPDGESKVYAPTIASGISAQNVDLADQASNGSTASVSIPTIGASSLGNITLAWRMTTAEYNLELAKAAAREQLEQIFDGYSKGDYSDENWDAIESAMTSGATNINAATSTSDVQKAAQAASDAMAAVPAKAGIDTAKAEGLARLADAYAGYEKSNYTDTAWNTLKAAYETAKKAANAAQSVAEANKAASDGVLAMAAVKPDASSGSGSSAGTGGSTGNGSGLNGSDGNAGTGGNSGSSNGDSASDTTGGSTAGATTGGSLNGTSSSGLASSSGGTASTSGSSLTSTSGSGLKSTSGTVYTKDTVDGSGSGLTSSPSADRSASVLGGKLVSVDESLAKDKNLKVTKGVYVESVEEGSPLDSAGIEEGDVITAIDGQSVDSKEDLDGVLAKHEPGDKVEITVDRNGRSVTYTVELGDDDSATDTLGAIGLSNGSFYGGDSLGGTDGESGIQEAPQWVIPACIFGLVLLAGIAGLVWWLMRRRNDGGSSDDDFWEEAPATA